MHYVVHDTSECWNETTAWAIVLHFTSLMKLIYQYQN